MPNGASPSIHLSAAWAIGAVGSNRKADKVASRSARRLDRACLKQLPRSTMAWYAHFSIRVEKKSPAQVKERGKDKIQDIFRIFVD